MGEAWGVQDPDALAQRIRALGRAEQRALIDALEQFWALQADAGATTATRDLLREVNLVRGANPA